MKAFSACLRSALFICLFVFSTHFLFGQSAGINSTPANTSASLDIGSTLSTPKLGLLIPRITLAQRTALSTLTQAAQGLMFYQTDAVEGFYYNTSLTVTPNWLYLSPSSVSGGWSLSGNAGTIDGTSFIGTTDNIPFNIRMNNQRAGRIDGTLANTFYGYQAANANPTGYQNTAIGYKTLFVNTSGIQNTSIGSGTLYSNTTGSFNTVTGFEGLYSNINGQYNTSDGFQALYSNTTGIGNTGIGTSTLYSNITGVYNTALGYSANVGAGGLVNATAIGANAMVSTSNSLVLGSAVNVGIGTSAPTAKLEIAGQIKITGGSPGAGKLLMSDAGGLASWSNSAAAWSLLGNAGTNPNIHFIGTTDIRQLVFKIDNQQAGFLDFDNLSQDTATGATGNTGFGFQTLISNDYEYNFGILNGVANTAVGCKALTANWRGSYNTGYGYKALTANYTGFNNTAVGAGALSISSESYHNTAIGVLALGKNTTGSGNTASGSAVTLNGSTIIPGQAGSALGSNTTGNYNTADGMGALYSNTTGSQNTALGFRADVSSVDLMNATAIGAYAIVGASNSLVLGGTGTNTVNVGIGITIPQEKLDVIGNIRSSTLALTGTKMVQADNNGTLIQLPAGTASQVLLGTGVWGSLPSVTNDWSILGNSNIVDNTNFIGTTNNIPFNIKVNNQKAGRIDPTLFNTFFGYQAGNLNTTGNWNTAVGNIAFRDNTTGHDNTAVGDEVLTLNTTGSGNSALGEGSLFRNTDGNNNTAIGLNAMSFNTSAGSNTAIGYNALYTQSYSAGSEWSSDNVAIGKEAMYLNQPVTINNGFKNTAVGTTALYSNTRGYGNIAIGYGADVTTGALNNSTAIGFNAKVSTSNSMVLGSTGSAGPLINVGIVNDAPVSRLDVNGAFGTTIKTVNSNTVLDNTAAVWYVVPTSAISLTLPVASSVTNRRYIITNRNDIHIVTISSYIDLAGVSATTVKSNAGMEIISDGTNWLQIK